MGLLKHILIGLSPIYTTEDKEFDVQVTVHRDNFLQ